MSNTWDEYVKAGERHLRVAFSTEFLPHEVEAMVKARKRYADIHFSATRTTKESFKLANCLGLLISLQPHGDIDRVTRLVNDYADLVEKYLPK